MTHAGEGTLPKSLTDMIKIRGFCEFFCSFCKHVSLASRGKKCYEICHGWICDIWCPSGPGLILGHENRNPEGRY